MNKKVKIALTVIKKVHDKFSETQEFIDKAYVEECHKENISVDDIFCSINNNYYFFLLLLCFSMVCYEIHYFLLYLIGSRYF